MNLLRNINMPLWRTLPVLALLLACLCLALLSLCDEFTPRAAPGILTVVGCLCLLFLGIWILLIMPWCWSGEADFVDTSPPRRRAFFLRALALAPAIAVTLTPMILFVTTLIDWIQDSRWDAREWTRPAWLLAIAATAAYGATFNHLLQRRLRRSAQRARICFNCAYSLAEIPNCERCPECGQGVESSGSSSRSGEATDAVARP